MFVCVASQLVSYVYSCNNIITSQLLSYIILANSEWTLLMGISMALVTKLLMTSCQLYCYILASQLYMQVASQFSSDLTRTGHGRHRNTTSLLNLVSHKNIDAVNIRLNIHKNCIAVFKMLTIKQLKFKCKIHNISSSQLCSFFTYQLCFFAYYAQCYVHDYYDYATVCSYMIL